MKKIFMFFAVFMTILLMVSCVADEDDETDSETNANADSEATPGGYCDAEDRFCITDSADGKEYSYACRRAKYVKIEMCKAGCDPDTKKCKIWKDPDSKLTWSSLAIRNKVYDEAMEYCDELEEAGYSDWHLPTISELRTLIQNCPVTEPGGECKVSDNCLSKSSCWKHEICSGCSGDEIYSKLGNTGEYLLSSSFVDTDIKNYWLYYVSFRDAGIFGTEFNASKNIRCVR